MRPGICFLDSSTVRLFQTDERLGRVSMKECLQVQVEILLGVRVLKSSFEQIMIGESLPFVAKRFDQNRIHPIDLILI